MSDDGRGGVAESSPSPGGPAGGIATCDVCGRSAPVARRYALLSRRLRVADERPAWERDGRELPPEEPDFQVHEFSTCAACERRKVIVWALAAAGLALWVPLVWKHAGLGFAYLLFFLSGMFALARFTPVNRLLRRLRQERRAEFPDLLKSRRIAYQFFTPGFVAIQQMEASRRAAPPGDRPSGADRRFACSRCGSALEELGVPAAIQLAQSYRSVVDIGTETVPESVKRDPFLYKGLFCLACQKAFCPSCAGQQAERCPACGAAGLQPAYRPYLRGAPGG